MADQVIQMKNGSDNAFPEIKQETWYPWATNNGHITAMQNGKTVTIRFYWASPAEVAAISLPVGSRPIGTIWGVGTPVVGSNYTPAIIEVNSVGGVRFANLTDSGDLSYVAGFGSITYVAS